MHRLLASSGLSADVLQAAVAVLPGAKLGAALLPGSGAELSRCLVLGAGDELLPASGAGLPEWKLRSAGRVGDAGPRAAGRVRTAFDAATWCQRGSQQQWRWQQSALSRIRPLLWADQSAARRTHNAEFDQSPDRSGSAAP